jgi:hypothetical protein
MSSTVIYCYTRTYNNEDTIVGFMNSATHPWNFYCYHIIASSLDFDTAISHIDKFITERGYVLDKITLDDDVIYSISLKELDNFMQDIDHLRSVDS